MKKMFEIEWPDYGEGGDFIKVIDSKGVARALHMSKGVILQCLEIHFKNTKFRVSEVPEDVSVPVLNAEGAASEMKAKRAFAEGKPTKRNPAVSPAELKEAQEWAKVFQAHEDSRKKFVEAWNGGPVVCESDANAIEESHAITKVSLSKAFEEIEKHDIKISFFAWGDHCCRIDGDKVTRSRRIVEDELLDAEDEMLAALDSED